MTRSYNGCRVTRLYNGCRVPGRTTGAELPGRTTGAELPGRTAGAELPGRTAGAELDWLFSDSVYQQVRLMHTPLFSPPRGSWGLYPETFVRLTNSLGRCYLRFEYLKSFVI